MNIQALIQELQPIFADRVTTNDHDLQQHGKDESSRPPMPPDAVCYPLNTDEVVAAVNACRQHHVPIVPFGAGSSLEGHVFALGGGLSIDLTRMDKVLRVSEGDLDCTVQAGVTRQQLNEHLKTRGLFFPVDPGAEATLAAWPAPAPAAPTRCATAPCAKTCSR